jgi:hypothetical protein
MTLKEILQWKTYESPFVRDFMILSFDGDDAILQPMFLLRKPKHLILLCSLSYIML